MQLGWIQASEVTRIQTLLNRLTLPTQLPANLSVEQLLANMKVDKKVRESKIRLVLLPRLEQAIVTDQYEPDLLTQCLTHVTHLAAVIPAIVRFATK